VLARRIIAMSFVVVVERRAGVRALDDWKPHKRGRIQSHSLSKANPLRAAASKQARGSIAILLSAFLSRDDALVWKRTRPTAFFLFSFWHTLSLSMVVVVRGTGRYNTNSDNKL